VLFRSERVDTIIMDKTGTLTEGKPRVVSVLPLSDLGEDELLRLAASVERSSEHPLAEAIVRVAVDRGLSLWTAEQFVAESGLGVGANVEGHKVLLGNLRFLESHQVTSDAPLDVAARMSERGESVVMVARDNKIVGVLGIADPLRKDAAETVTALRRQGVRVIMATGDQERTARVVAAQVHVDEVHAAMLPADKEALVRKLRAAGRVVAMAGDGINDAPALMAADVGLAMGGGAHVAAESAGITLVGGDVRGILRARQLSRSVMRNIRQNLAWAFGYNILGIPIAAGVLYPFFGLLLSPVVASIAMSFSSVSVITNALRLRRIAL
jgi:P-type Cu+ transporter